MTGSTHTHTHTLARFETEARGLTHTQTGKLGWEAHGEMTEKPLRHQHKHKHEPCQEQLCIFPKGGAEDQWPWPKGIQNTGTLARHH